MPVTAADFRRAMGQFASGVTVVTTRAADGQPLGLTVSSFCSVSLDPPLVLACVDKRSDAVRGFLESGRFAVSILGEEQQDVSGRFAYVEERFEGYAPQAPGGLVLIPGARAHLECALVATHDGGDHWIYVGQVQAVSVDPGAPLLYHAGRYRELAEDGAGVLAATRPAAAAGREGEPA